MNNLTKYVPTKLKKINRQTMEQIDISNSQITLYVMMAVQLKRSKQNFR